METETRRRLPVVHIQPDPVSDAECASLPKDDSGFVVDTTLWSILRTADDSAAAKFSKLYKAVVKENIAQIQEQTDRIAQFAGKGGKYLELACFSLAELTTMENGIKENLRYLTQLNHPYRLAINILQRTV